MIRILILALLFGSTDPIEIAKINRLKNEAEKAYTKGDYERAKELYGILSDSMNVDSDEIKLNLAHSYFQLNDTSSARSLYSQVSMSNNKKLKSIAYQQLGVMSKNPQTLKESLQYLKASLKADPTNEGARYDYEVVKKLLEQQQEQQQKQDQNQENQDEDKNDQKQQQNEDQEQNQDQNQDQQDQENQEEKENQDQQQQEKENSEKKEGEENEQQQEQEGEENKEEPQDQQDMNTKQKLEEMNISEEKAKMILEAMKNAEVQYLQQQKRKATKKPESGKPDW